jgi:hypothetical protein
MELRNPLPSSDEDTYQLGGREFAQATRSLSTGPAIEKNLGGDVVATPSGVALSDRTMVADPVTVAPDAKSTAPDVAAVEAVVETTKANPPEAATESDTVTDPGAPPTQADRPAPGKPVTSTSPSRPSTKLRPRRRQRVRMRHLMQAWIVSLIVHVVILSALAAATFTATDTVKKILNFDSALTGFRNGEPEVLPIYADPDNLLRNQAVGDEHASTPSEPALVVMGEGDGDDGGGSIATGASGASSPSRTPRVRGVGKGRINEGTNLPGVKIEGLGGSPLSLLPAAPAADLGSGGKIAGDPLFEVKEIGSALDQLAREILRHLKDHKLTVVWLFDESTSMQDDQKSILQKFDRVSSELKLNVDPNKKNAGALNHAIVGFGQEMDYVLEKPRDDIDQIGRAIKNLKIDSTGIENTMQAIRLVVERYANVVQKGRRLLIVLVTDESGDDGTFVEEARQALTKYKVPLYVIGRQALFGYPYAHHQYIDPVTKDVYHPLIRRGPETADVELYQWDGLYDRWDEQPSGFAPYELARLTRDSGGVYFVLPSEEFMRVRQREQAYSIAQLKEYMPEYDNRLSYIERRNSSTLRRQIHDIVLEGKAFIYRRGFPIEPADMVKAALEEGQKATVKLNELLAIQKRLEQLVKDRNREPEKRWQAHYDLMLAQTVAFEVKAYEYRALMASLAKNPPRSNRQATPDTVTYWVVNHSKEPLAPRNETAKKYVEAERLLQEVIVRHAKTPWADLAQDCLNRGLSVRLDLEVHNSKYYERAQFVPKY